MSTPRPCSALEKGQKTRAKRRHLDVVDRGLMDLVSVYRDAIALGTGAPRPRWSTRRCAAEIVSSPGSRAPRPTCAGSSAIFAAREQMLEFNVPPALALESMMVALRLTDGGRR